MKYKTILLTMLFGAAIQTQGGTAATHLANIDPTAGGSIDSAGSYYLGYDISGNITITVSDVILDLNGHVITGNIIMEDSLKNIAVTKGIAQNVTVNSGCNNVILSKLTLGNSANCGISATNTTNLFIEHTLIQNTDTNDNCILTGCQNITIIDALFINGSHGIVMSTCSDGLIVRCYMSNASSSGLRITSSNRIAFVECMSHLNGIEGFGAPGANGISNDISFINCAAEANGQSGFAIKDGSCGSFDNCIAANNGTGPAIAGFRAEDNVEIVVQECIAFNNTGDGFRTTGAEFTSNYAYLNTTNYSGVGGTASPTGGSAQFWRNITDT